MPPAKHAPDPPEMTFRAVALGLLLALVFGAANAYLGMFAGMTVSASVPAAVISMALLRALGWHLGEIPKEYHGMAPEHILPVTILIEDKPSS